MNHVVNLFSNTVNLKKKIPTNKNIYLKDRIDVGVLRSYSTFFKHFIFFYIKNYLFLLTHKILAPTIQNNNIIESHKADETGFVQKQNYAILFVKSIMSTLYIFDIFHKKIINKNLHFIAKILKNIFNKMSSCILHLVSCIQQFYLFNLQILFQNIFSHFILWQHYSIQSI